MTHDDLTLFNVWSPGIAKACEQNLRKTFQFGGRSVYPSSMELKAIMVNNRVTHNSYFYSRMHSIDQKW